MKHDFEEILVGEPALLSFADLKRCGLFNSRSSLSRARKFRRFPSPIRINSQAARYAKVDVEAWLRDRR